MMRKECSFIWYKKKTNKKPKKIGVGTFLGSY